MKSELRWLSVVILAENHNPGIPSKDWLEGKGILKEKAKNFVNTPIFSLFESENFRLTIDEKRLEILLLRPSEEKINELVHVASSYVDSLPETPYKALGNNIHWQIVCNDKEARNKILADIFVNNKSPFWEPILKYSPEVGGIIYWKFESFKVRLIVEPREETLIFLNFNYHYDIESLGNLLENLDKFKQCYINSAEIKNNIMRLGG